MLFRDYSYRVYTFNVYKIINDPLANALELSQKYKLFELGQNIIVYDTVLIEQALYRGFSANSELLIEPQHSQVVVYHSSRVS